MNANFSDAHHRHWQDAETLFISSRFANADHLYGLSAECGLKHLMSLFGMALDSDKGNYPHDRSDRTHINQLWGRYEMYQSGHWTTDYVLPQTNPFVDWDVSQRYTHQSNFDKARASVHRKGAELVRDLMKKADREGLS